MQIVYLHGPPAAGKLTTARALMRLCDARLFDNHAVTNAVSTVLDYDTPGFWPLVRDLRLNILRAAAQSGANTIITTACFELSEDLPLFEAYEALAAQTGGAVLPAYLACPDQTLLDRVNNPDRAAKQKINSQAALVQFMQDRNFSPVSRDTCLMLDSQTQSATSNAARIVAHFGLEPR